MVSFYSAPAVLSRGKIVLFGARRSVGRNGQALPPGAPGRTAEAWGSTSGCAGQALRQSHPIRVGRPAYGSLPLPLPSKLRRTGAAAAKEKKRSPAPHCAGSGEKLPRAPQGHTRAGLQLDGAGKVFSPKRLSTVGRRDEAAKRKTTLRPPRRIGTAPLPPRLFPRAPTQCGQRAPTKERTGEIFQCAVGFTRGAELSPPFRECSPHRTHGKGGRSCLALQDRPNCARITLSPYTSTLCDRGAPVKNVPDGTFPAHCRIEICRKRMEPSPPARYARPVGCTVEGAGPSFQSRPRHVNTAPSPTPRLNTTGARLQKSALGEGPPARRLIWTYERGKVVPPT